MNTMRFLLAIVIGLIAGTPFAGDAITALIVGSMVAVPGYVALTVINRLLNEDISETNKMKNLLWELGFLFGVVTIGAGLGMMMASALGWSATPQQPRYPILVTIFATVSLLLGYHVTSPVGRQQTS